MTPLESLRQKLDDAHIAAIAADDGYGSTTDIRNALADLLSDCNVLVRDEAENDPEAVADRECEERHVRGLRSWHVGRV